MTGSDGSIDSEDAAPPCVDERSWTPGGDGVSDYVDFVQLETGHFLHAPHNAGVIDAPQLGPVVAEVCLELSAVTFAGPWEIQIGDAAYLSPGTKLREIAGADPALRLGTVVGGDVLIYELFDPPDAVVGGQVIDLGVNVDEITINQVDDGATVLASISEPDAVESLVTAVRTAPIDRSPRSEATAGEPEYILEFHRDDGTSTRRRYRPAIGELANDIIVPEETRLLLVGLLAEVETEVAATTTTTGGVQTTTESTVGSGRVNEAESNLRYDFGAIVGTSVEGGVTWVQFDRYQLGIGENGTDLTREVRIEGATDLLWANNNPRLRWFPVASDVEVLELEPGWSELICDGSPDDDVGFVASSLDRLISLDARLVSLTFVNREVAVIRDQRSC